MSGTMATPTMPQREMMMMAPVAESQVTADIEEAERKLIGNSPDRICFIHSINQSVNKSEMMAPVAVQHREPSQGRDRGGRTEANWQLT